MGESKVIWDFHLVGGLALLSLHCSKVNCSLLIFIKRFAGIFIRIAYNVEEMTSWQWTWNIFLFCSSEFCKFPYMDLIHILLVIPVYFFFLFFVFGTNINSNVFQILNSTHSYQIYRKAIGFCILTSVLQPYYSLLISFRNFFVDSFGFFT